MKLDDLGRPRLRYRIGWGVLAGVTVVALALAGWLAHLNYTLIEANLDLVRLLDTQLNVTQARMSRLEAVQRESYQALLSGDPQTFVDVLRREGDK